MKIQDVINKLRENGYKITPQRQEIISVLMREKRHLTVEEIHNRIAHRYPNLSPDTVYRNVGVLARLNVLARVDFGDGRARYKLLERDGHKHYLVCLGCGNSEEVAFCPLDYLDDELIKDKKFDIRRHSFEIYGYCWACRQKGANYGH